MLECQNLSRQGEPLSLHGSLSDTKLLHTWSHAHHRAKNGTAGALLLYLSCQLRLLRVLSPLLLTYLALEGWQQDVGVLPIREGYTSHVKCSAV